ncbi:hypothetical protein J6590_067909 [Homalodisca vitripennis]|nr:hypothetical protein J6590_067909 [Homalodisca vitripennis]
MVQVIPGGFLRDRFGVAQCATPGTQHSQCATPGTQHRPCATPGTPQTSLKSAHFIVEMSYRQISNQADKYLQPQGRQKRKSASLAEGQT